MADIVQPFAFVFEIAGTGKGVFAAGKELRKGGKRVGLSLIAYGLVINDSALDFRIVAIFDFFAGLDIAHGKAERRLALLVLGVDLLCGFLRLFLCFVHGDPLQLVRAAVDLRNGFQNGIGVLRRHGVKLTDALLPVEILNGTQVGIQLINDAVDLQIGKPRVDLIRRINAKRKGNAFAPVQLLQPLINIVRMHDFGKLLKNCLLFLLWPPKPF